VNSGKGIITSDHDTLFVSYRKCRVPANIPCEKNRQAF
jgi:hypothetical protein